MEGGRRGAQRHAGGVIMVHGRAWDGRDGWLRWSRVVVVFAGAKEKRLSFERLGLDTGD